MPTLRVFPDADRVETALVDAAGQEGFVDGGGFRSIGQLVEALDGARFLKRRPCSALTARVVLWSAARDVRPNPFGAFAQEPAFARSALDLVFDLKAGLLGPAGFVEAVRELSPSRQHRARALADLYEAYEARMLKLGLADREDVLRGATERVRVEGLPPALARFEAIAFQAVYDFAPSRLALVTALAQACAASGKRFELELPASGTPGIDSAVDGVLAELERRHAELPHLEVRKEDRLEDGRSLAPWARWMFSDAPVPPGAPAPGLLSLRALSTPRAEVREMARLAREQLDRGVAPERVALAFRSLGEEAEWLEEALADVGVPARIRRGQPLSSTAAGRLALELPVLVDDAFPAAGVARVLSHRYARAVSQPPLEAPARALAAAGIRDNRLGAEGPRGAYPVRLSALVERLQSREPDAAAQAQQVLDRARRLIALLEPRLPERAKASELLSGWWSAVEELGILDALRQPEPRGVEGTLGAEVTRALARDQAAAEALRALVGELDAALKSSGAGAESMQRRTFHRWLSDAATDFNLTPAGPRAGAVRVLDVRELPGRSFDAVYIGGMVDGRFPARETQHPLFPEEDRRSINRWARRDVFRVTAGEIGLRAPWGLSEDRLLMYQALTASRGPTAVSFARTGASGAEQLASPFLDELARLTGQPVSLVPLAPIRPLGAVASEVDLHTRLAFEAFAPLALRSQEPQVEARAVRDRHGQEAWWPKAERLVEIEAERLSFFSDPARAPGAFSGAVLDPALLPWVAKAFAFDARHPLDATALGRFGNCAFQGFLQFVLRVREEDAPGEDLDARGQGIFWHAVLERLFALLGEAELVGHPIEDVPPAILDRALQDAVESAAGQMHLGHPVLWKLGQERARAMARRLLAHPHHGLPLPGLAPERAEVSFGRPTSPPGWREVPLPLTNGPPVFLSGFIDRVDRGAQASAVIDYKPSVKNSRFKERFLVDDFQLPVYLHALRHSGHRGALEGAWLSMRDGEAVRLSGVLGATTVEELLELEPEARSALQRAQKKNLANAVEQIVAGLRDGRFGARPHDCEYCRFRALCRISDRKIEERPGG